MLEIVDSVISGTILMENVLLKIKTMDPSANLHMQIQIIVHLMEIVQFGGVNSTMQNSLF
jgi:hypothetical protein